MNTTHTTTGHTGTTGTTGAGQPDMVDKVAASAQTKLGLGNTQKSAGMREKITDKLRTLFESKSGKKVPAKISN